MKKSILLTFLITITLSNAFSLVPSLSKEWMGKVDFFNKKTHQPSIADTTFQPIIKIDIQSTYLTVDNLQNVYLATTQGQVLKYNKEGQIQFEYNNNRLGRIGKIDVRNPLNILVYYPELEVVVILDRTLSEIRTLQLFDLEILDPKGITIANDNSIWVYDQVAAVLKKVNQKGEVLFESRNLNQLTQKNLNPSFLQESNNLLYLSDQEEGIFIFDTFGQLIQYLPIKGIERFEVNEQQIIFWKNGQLFIFFTDTQKEIPINLPLSIKPDEQLLIHQNFLYHTSQEAITIYQRKDN